MALEVLSRVVAEMRRAVAGKRRGGRLATELRKDQAAEIVTRSSRQAAAEVLAGVAKRRAEELPVLAKGAAAARSRLEGAEKLVMDRRVEAVHAAAREQSLVEDLGALEVEAKGILLATAEPELGDLRTTLVNRLLGSESGEFVDTRTAAEAALAEVEELILAPEPPADLEERIVRLGKAGVIDPVEAANRKALAESNHAAKLRLPVKHLAHAMQLSRTRGEQ